jgi:hypothetical protein
MAADGEKVYRVVETDSFGGDYPDESFASPRMTKEAAERLADTFNKAVGENYPRFWKVEKEPYKLVPGFEP